MTVCNAIGASRDMETTLFAPKTAPTQPSVAMATQSLFQGFPRFVAASATEASKAIDVKDVP